MWRVLPRGLRDGDRHTAGPGAGAGDQRPLILARVASIPAGRPSIARVRPAAANVRTSVRPRRPANRHRGLDLYGPGTCMPPPANIRVRGHAVAACGVIHARRRAQQCNAIGQRHGRPGDSGTSGVWACAPKVARLRRGMHGPRGRHGPYALTIKLAAAAGVAAGRPCPTGVVAKWNVRSCVCRACAV